MLLRLLRAMDRYRFSNHVVCLSKPSDVGKKIRALGIPLYCLNMRGGKISGAGLFLLLKIILFVRPVILQTWMYHSDLLGLLAGRLAMIRNILWNVRCSFIDLAGYRASTKWVLRACKVLSVLPGLIITNSNEAKRYHIRLGYRRGGWEVIPNGVDLEEFKPQPWARSWLVKELGLNPHWTGQGLDDRRGPFFIGFVARFDPMKDHPSFVRAACRVLEEGRDAHFVLAGRAVSLENAALSRLIPDKWESRFHLLGIRYDIEKIAAGLDIASLVSHGESFPNVVCEAMACGVPCVVTDVGDAAAIVGATGMVVPPGDPVALARAWSQVMDMPENALRLMGERARKRVEEHYDIRLIAGRYESLYEGLAKGNKT